MAKGDKTDFRQRLRKLRFSLGDGERTLKSRAIVRCLKKTVDWSEVRTVHYFEPIRRLVEADISDLVTHLEDNYPKIQLFTPRLINGAWQMISIKDRAAPKNFDIILVPMLGFDPDTLQRIGYGGGYYDRFLATQTKAKKIGVCFESGKQKGIPAEAHDVPLDVVVTEQKIYTI